MKPSKRPPWSMSLVVLAVAVLAAGCAGSRRQVYLERKAGEHVYRKPLAEVWPAARGLLAEKNLPLREGAGEYELATDWHPVGESSSPGTSYMRYRVRGRESGPSLSAVEFIRQYRTESEVGAQGGGTPGRRTVTHETSRPMRDHALEWELLQRVDPKAAQALKAESERIR
jgi:hypothetical protein